MTAMGHAILVLLITAMTLGLPALAGGHSTQACLKSAAVESAIGAAVAECQARAQEQLAAKDAEIARLQGELAALKTALPCARIVYSPDDLKLAQQQPGPICVLVDTIQTCTTDYCDGYWQGDPIKKTPMRLPTPPRR